MKPVNVISFILYRNGKVLAEQRKLTERSDPGKIIIPSGHVEQGETFEEACRREMREELSLECEKFRFVTSLPYRSNVEEMVIHYYECLEWKGVPKSISAERIFWIGPERFSALEEVDQEALRIFFGKQE